MEAAENLKEANEMREGYVELGLLYYNQGKWLDCINNLIIALSIKNKPHPKSFVGKIGCTRISLVK